MTNNVFAAASQKAKADMRKAVSSQTAAEEEGTKAYKVVNCRIPKELHKKLYIHRAETGESMTKLVTRILSEEMERCYPSGK